MTSTNDGKEVKSNQTSGLKGKTYYIELYKTLETQLNAESSFTGRVQTLCLAWRHVHTLCLHSAPPTHPHLSNWIQRHTARTVLQSEWQSQIGRDEQPKLEEALEAFIQECQDAASTRNGSVLPWESQLLGRAAWYKSVLSNLWGHPVLKALSNRAGDRPSTDEVLTWLKEERGIFFAARLRQLALSRCEDIALTLLTAVMDDVRVSREVISDLDLADERKATPESKRGEPTFESFLSTEAGFSEVWDLLTDMELVLLHKSDRNSRVIELAKQMPLSSGYQVVDRLLNRLNTAPREKKLWKNAKDVATLVTQLMITRCMIVPVCAGVVRTVLYWCARALVRAVPCARIARATATLAAPATSARHLHTLATAVHAQQSSESDELKPFVVELYVRAITFGMNELEKLKLKPEYEEVEARATEQTLATWFIQFGHLLARSERMKCECILTAFSVHPSPTMYEKIKKAPLLPPVAVEVQPKQDPETVSEFGSWANDSHSQTNFVKTSGHLNIQQTQHQANVLSTAILNEGEALGLEPELCQDIIVLLSGPRVKTLSWDVDRKLLLSNCLVYMDRTGAGTRALTTELKYLNLDPRHYQHLPEECDHEDDLYYGIEKGYEHLVELEQPQPEQIWEDAYYGFEQTESPHSSDAEETTQQRKKKNKQFSTDSDSDPLSMVADKKEKKKERPHSKERSKEETKKKKKPKETDKSKDVKDKEQTESKDVKEKSKAHVESRKSEPKVKKEKKERKKREKKEKKPKNPLIGVKVTTIKSEDTSQDICVTDNNYDSQEKSSLPSDGMDENVVYDGEFAMDVLKSPDKSKTYAEIHSQPNTKPSPGQHASCSTANSSGHTISEDMKDRITKLLHFRRQKSNSPMSSPSALDRSTQYALVGTKLSNTTSISFNKKQDTLTTTTKSEAKQHKAIIYPPNVSDPTSTCTRVQPFNPALSRKTPRMSASPQGNEMTNVSQQRSVIANNTSCQSSSQKQDSKSTLPSTENSRTQSDSTHLSSYEKFLLELESGDREPLPPIPKTKTPNRKQIKPTNKVTPVIPHIFNSETNTSAMASHAVKPGNTKVPKHNNYVKPDITLQKANSDHEEGIPILNFDMFKEELKIASKSAKPIQSRKKVESYPNTFSRLSYMHKNKQQLESSISEELDRRIAEMKTHKMKRDLNNKNDYFSRITNVGSLTKPKECPRVEVQHIENLSAASSSSLNQNHPLLTSILKNTALTIKTLKDIQKSTTDKPLILKKTNNTSLTEKDQQELLKLLGQQNILNKPQLRPNIDNQCKKAQNKIPSTNQVKIVNTNTVPIKSFGQPEPFITRPITPRQTPVPERIENKVSSQTKFDVTSLKCPVISNSTIMKTTAMVQNKAQLPKCKTNTSKQTMHEQNMTVLEVNKTITKKYFPKPTVSTKQQPREELPDQDWKKVLNDLKSHQTPVRGPNALHMTLNKDSFEKVIERNRQINSPTPGQKADNTVKKAAMAIQVNNTSQSMAPSTSCFSAHKSDLKKVEKQQSAKKICQNTETFYPALTKKVNKETDPFISGIPNSDYEILEELMDDDLRQEIGELLSEDENYQVPPASAKSRKPIVNKNQVIIKKITAKKRKDPVNVLTQPSVINSPKSSAVTKTPKTKLEIISNEKVDFRTFTTNLIGSKVIRQKPNEVLVKPQGDLNSVKKAVSGTSTPMSRNVAQSHTAGNQNNATSTTTSKIFYDTASASTVQSIISTPPVQNVISAPPVQNMVIIDPYGMSSNSYIAMHNNPNVIYQQFTAPVASQIIIPNSFIAMPTPAATVNVVYNNSSQMIPSDVPIMHIPETTPVTAVSQNSNISLQDFQEFAIVNPAAKVVNDNTVDPVNVQSFESVEKDLSTIVDGNLMQFKTPEPTSQTKLKVTLEGQQTTPVPRWTTPEVETSTSKPREQKVLAKIQEKVSNMSFAIKNSPVKTEKPPLETNMKDVYTDKDKLIKKRLAIMNRNINNRGLYPPIPLDYSSLIIEDPIQKLIVNSSINIKENNNSCRRILLRSSNRIEPDANYIENTKKPVRKTKVRLKNVTTQSQTLRSNGAEFDSTKNVCKTKESLQEKSSNEKGNKTRASKRIKKVKKTKEDVNSKTVTNVQLSKEEQLTSILNKKETSYKSEYICSATMTDKVSVPVTSRGNIDIEETLIGSLITKPIEIQDVNLTMETKNENNISTVLNFKRNDTAVKENLNENQDQLLLQSCDKINKGNFLKSLNNNKQDEKKCDKIVESINNNEQYKENTLKPLAYKIFNKNDEPISLEKKSAVTTINETTISNKLSKLVDEIESAISAITDSTINSPLVGTPPDDEKVNEENAQKENTYLKETTRPAERGSTINLPLLDMSVESEQISERNTKKLSMYSKETIIQAEIQSAVDLPLLDMSVEIDEENARKEHMYLKKSMDNVIVPSSFGNHKKTDKNTLIPSDKKKSHIVTVNKHRNVTENSCLVGSQTNQTAEQKTVGNMVKNDLLLLDTSDKVGEDTYIKNEEAIVSDLTPNIATVLSTHEQLANIKEHEAKICDKGKKEKSGLKSTINTKHFNGTNAIGELEALAPISKEESLAPISIDESDAEESDQLHNITNNFERPFLKSIIDNKDAEVIQVNSDSDADLNQSKIVSDEPTVTVLEAKEASIVDIPQSIRNSIQITEIPIPGNTLPDKRCVRIKLPNKVFKATVHGKMNISVDTLFEDPALMKILLDSSKDKKRYTLSFQQTSTTDHRVLETVVHEVDIPRNTNSEKPVEFVSLISDDEDEPSQTIKTASGLFKVKCMDQNILFEHQKKLSQKTLIKLNRCDEKPKTTALVQALLDDLALNSAQSSEVIEIDSSDDEVLEEHTGIDIFKNLLLKDLGVADVTQHQTTNEQQNGIQFADERPPRTRKSKYHRERETKVTSIESEKRSLSRSKISESCKTTKDMPIKQDSDALSKENNDSNVITQGCFIKLVNCDNLVQKLYSKTHLNESARTSDDKEISCTLEEDNMPIIKHSGSFSIINKSYVLDELVRPVDGATSPVMCVFETIHALRSATTCSRMISSVPIILEPYVSCESDNKWLCQTDWFESKHGLRLQELVVHDIRTVDEIFQENVQSKHDSSSDCETDVATDLSMTTADNINLLAEANSSRIISNVQINLESYLSCESENKWLCQTDWFQTKHSLRLQELVHDIRTIDDIFQEIVQSKHDNSTDCETDDATDISMTTAENINLFAEANSSRIISNVQINLESYLSCETEKKWLCQTDWFQTKHSLRLQALVHDIRTIDDIFQEIVQSEHDNSTDRETDVATNLIMATADNINLSAKANSSRIISDVSIKLESYLSCESENKWLCQTDWFETKHSLRLQELVHDVRTIDEIFQEIVQSELDNSTDCETDDSIDLSMTTADNINLSAEANTVPSLISIMSQYFENNSIVYRIKPNVKLDNVSRNQLKRKSQYPDANESVLKKVTKVSIFSFNQESKSSYNDKSVEFHPKVSISNDYTANTGVNELIPSTATTSKIGTCNIVNTTRVEALSHEETNVENVFMSKISIARTQTFQPSALSENIHTESSTASNNKDFVFKEISTGTEGSKPKSSCEVNECIDTCEVFPFNTHTGLEQSVIIDDDSTVPEKMCDEGSTVTESEISLTSEIEMTETRNTCSVMFKRDDCSKDIKTESSNVTINNESDLTEVSTAPESPNILNEFIEVSEVVVNSSTVLKDSLVIDDNSSISENNEIIAVTESNKSLVLETEMSELKITCTEMFKLDEYSKDMEKLCNTVTIKNESNLTELSIAPDASVPKPPRVLNECIETSEAVANSRIFLEDSVMIDDTFILENMSNDISSVTESDNLTLALQQEMPKVKNTHTEMFKQDEHKRDEGHSVAIINKQKDLLEVSNSSEILIPKSLNLLKEVPEVIASNKFTVLEDSLIIDNDSTTPENIFTLDNTVTKSGNLLDHETGQLEDIQTDNSTAMVKKENNLIEMLNSSKPSVSKPPSESKNITEVITYTFPTVLEDSMTIDDDFTTSKNSFKEVSAVIESHKLSLALETKNTCTEMFEVDEHSTDFQMKKTTAITINKVLTEVSAPVPKYSSVLTECKETSDEVASYIPTVLEESVIFNSDCTIIENLPTTTAKLHDIRSPNKCYDILSKFHDVVPEGVTTPKKNPFGNELCLGLNKDLIKNAILEDSKSIDSANTGVEMSQLPDVDIKDSIVTSTCSTTTPVAFAFKNVCVDSENIVKNFENNELPIKHKNSNFFNNQIDYSMKTHEDSTTTSTVQPTELEDGVKTTPCLPNEVHCVNDTSVISSVSLKIPIIITSDEINTTVAPKESKLLPESENKILDIVHELVVKNSKTKQSSEFILNSSNIDEVSNKDDVIDNDDYCRKTEGSNAIENFNEAKEGIQVQCIEFSHLAYRAEYSDDDQKSQKDDFSVHSILEDKQTGSNCIILGFKEKEKHESEVIVIDNDDSYSETEDVTEGTANYYRKDKMLDLIGNESGHIMTGDLQNSESNVCITENNYTKNTKTENSCCSTVAAESKVIVNDDCLTEKSLEIKNSDSDLNVVVKTKCIDSESDNIEPNHVRTEIISEKMDLKDSARKIIIAPLETSFVNQKNIKAADSVTFDINSKYDYKTEVLVEVQDEFNESAKSSENHSHRMGLVKNNAATKCTDNNDDDGRCVHGEKIIVEKTIKEVECDENIFENNPTLVYKDNSGVILTGIQYEDPEIGTCYVFPIAQKSDEGDSEVLNSSLESTIEVIQEIEVITDEEPADLYDKIYLRVIEPKRTYSKHSLKRKSNMKDVACLEKKRRYSKGYESFILKGTQKSYRKGKNIDMPKMTSFTMAESGNIKDFKRRLDYYSTVRFSYAITYSTEFIDTFELLKKWPIQGLPRSTDGIYEKEHALFTELDNDRISHDPLQLTLVDEISAGIDKMDYPNWNTKEINFNMGFGEESGRVKQNLDGTISKVSAATLSDVKQIQPCLMSNKYESASKLDISESSKREQLQTIKRYLTYIQLRDKVRSFFKNTFFELTSEIGKRGIKESTDNYDPLFPFELFNSKCIDPFPTETVVQVVQVGQLPVSAAAQNPVTCDPRVTQVSDASPSQCSAVNSPHEDTQTEIKTEYTELTTADLSLPLVDDYVHHNQPLPLNSKDATNTENIPIQTELLKSEVKIELVEEPPEEKEDEDADMNNHVNNTEYSYDSNNVNPSVESDFQSIFDSEKQDASENMTHEKPHNGSSEKTDQIAHAMNAAGITTTTETANTRAQALVNMLTQKLRQGAIATTPNSNYPKATSINAMSLQQALASILPPPLNQTSSTDSNQQGQNTVTPQVLHIVQGKNASGNQITLVDNAQQSVITTPNTTPVLHIVQNKAASSGQNTNGSSASQPNTFSGLSLVDTGLQQGGNQLLHIVNTGNQKNNAGQLLKRVNLLTNLANVQGPNEQKMVQFVCKSADGKAIQLNAPHQRSMVLRLQPIESPNVQSATPKPADINQDLSSSQSAQTPTNKDSTPTQQEIKSRSVYEENYAKFIQNSSNKPTLPEKSNSLPKFNQAFGKAIFQDGNQKQGEMNTGNLSSVSANTDSPECPASDNAINLDHIGQISSPPLLLRKSPAQTTQAQQNLVQQIKQSIAPMNIQTMHGGVIYTRQIPVNIGGGQTINLITVPSTELIDESGQKQQTNQGEAIEPSIIKIVPQNQPSNAEVSEDMNNDNAQQGTPQPQPVLTQMRIKLPMLSKTPQMVSAARVVRPSFFQIQRNVIGGANQAVYQQLVLTAAPPLGQQTIRLPQAQARQIKVPENQSSSESQMSSSTLEQLREFDMVLEQVKERSTVQPSSNSSSSNFKLHASTTDTTDSPATATSNSAETTQVLYSIGSGQPLNVTYVNRKPSVSAPTTSSFARSPDSSGIADSPTSSSHSHAPHTSNSESISGETTSHHKAVKVSSKSKSRPKSSTHPPNSIKLNTVPPKTSTQKPLEDEQTTQRILYILAEYKEQVENSPDKDKPAPRRRSNPPSNPSGSSKRKKSSSGSRRSGRDISPIHGDDTCRTMGSEDSSCGTSQGDCTESCMDSHSPQDSPRKVARKLAFEQDSPSTPSTTQPRPQPQRNVIVADGQTITVARGTAGKPATAVLMPANYILPVSMVKGGQQIAIVTNRGPKLLTVGGGEGGATNALLLQRLIGPAGLKPVLTRPGVRHVRLPTAALHNLQTFNLATATSVQPPDSTASPAPDPPPDLIDSNRSDSSPWTDRESEVKPDRASSPDESEPWNLPSSADPHDYSYEETVRADNMDRTVLDPIQDRYSPDMEAQRIFDKMFDVDTKKSYIVDSPRCAYDIDASDCDDKPYQVVHKKDSSHRQTRVAHVSAAALRHKYAILEHELRLQKSLSEECEDLGVDSPSASELFPEAELLFATSPAQDHGHDTSQHSHTPQPAPLNQSVIQPDIDDQIATDQLLPRPPAPRRPAEPLGGLEDVGIVTVSGDGMQATIALDQEEFARAHPNTTFHSEPTDEVVQPFTISALKSRHITSTIFHSNRAPATVLMTAPQATVISQATADTPQNSVKYSEMDMIHSIPSTHTNNMNLSSVLVKDDGLTRFDNILTDSRELHLSSTASTIVHPTGNATQVIRRVCYDDGKRERESFLMDEPEALIAGDDAKMVAEDSSRDATLESMGGDVDDDNSSPERHAELFWESNSASERSESRRPLDFSSDSEKCCKSPSYDETNSTDSSGVGTHMRLDSVIKEARGVERSGSADGSSADDTHPPLRTYPPKRLYHNTEGEMERSLSGKTRAGERSPDTEVRRRASGRGVVKRGCHCCNGSPAPPRAKKPRQRKPTMDFTN